jgi:hypothetical protein
VVAKTEVGACAENRTSALRRAVLVELAQLFTDLFVELFYVYSGVSGVRKRANKLLNRYLQCASVAFELFLGSQEATASAFS